MVSDCRKSCRVCPALKIRAGKCRQVVCLTYPWEREGRTGATSSLPVMGSIKICLFFLPASGQATAAALLKTEIVYWSTTVALQ